MFYILLVFLDYCKCIFRLVEFFKGKKLLIGVFVYNF